ncbi:hypothetical protein Pcinc_024226 [Petrolisthes cinctipes]|uniref:Uncharacterized protein n=1 Tax=Petrolisthes cinctipes TaxID=88211 RepID=A0AAE1FCH8_PETCI|nr:hypothetical protein Pcinc_024226 [Petrolisthes cinctipes]
MSGRFRNEWAGLQMSGGLRNEWAGLMTSGRVYWRVGGFIEEWACVKSSGVEAKRESEHVAWTTRHMHHHLSSKTGVVCSGLGGWAVATGRASGAVIPRQCCRVW